MYFPADVGDEQRLDAVDVANAQTVQLGAEQIEKPAMEPLDQPRQFEVFFLHCHGSFQRGLVRLRQGHHKFAKVVLRAPTDGSEDGARRLSRWACFRIRLSACRSPRTTNFHWH